MTNQVNSHNADRYLSEAIKGTTDVQDNIEQVKTNFEKIVGKAVDDGQIIVETKRLIRDVYWTRANDRSRTATRRQLDDYLAGHFTLTGIDSFFQTPMSVGRDRRTTLDLFDKRDMNRVVKESLDNKKKVDSRHTITLAVQVQINDLLDKFGSLRKAVDKGAIYPAVDDDDQEESA